MTRTMIERQIALTLRKAQNALDEMDYETAGQCATDHAALVKLLSEIR
jgi:hypothetical protein